MRYRFLIRTVCKVATTAAWSRHLLLLLVVSFVDWRTIYASRTIFSSFFKIAFLASQPIVMCLHVATSFKKEKIIHSILSLETDNVFKLSPATAASAVVKMPTLP